MGVTEILTIISGLIQFPGVILEFIKILKKTPAEQHDALLKSLKVESDKFEQEGRPSW